MSDSFAHLHVHTEYSMLDGASRVSEAVASAVADGQPAMAITDHGNMYGVLDFYRTCRDSGIKPIIGTEIYLAHESRHERPNRRGRVDDSGGDTSGGKKLYYHAILLAESQVGYRNLIQLSSQAFLTGYHYKPRADFELMEQYSEGIIATSGCLGGHVCQALIKGDPQAALDHASRFQDIFGRDNFFIELQDHGIEAQRSANPRLIEIAKTLNAPLLATNDSHYTRRHDAHAHDALLCVQTGSQLDDENRFRFHGDQHYIKSGREMRALFAEQPEACDNTLRIAERCDVEIEFGKPRLPRFPLPEGFASDTQYLRHLTMEGARRRWGSDLHDSVAERLDFELGVIDRMGFSAYFLITWDLVRYARENGIRVGPGRGSAAGCAVAYSLCITDLDPIRFDLLFERFLNPSRVSMPDIDIDFDTRYRDELIRYAADRYGRDNVAQIVTFSQIKARAAVRDAARVLGCAYSVGDKIAKAMPPLVMGRATSLQDCLEEHPKHKDGYRAAAQLRKMVEEDPEVAKVVDVARGLEGLRRQDGVHAAAVVITDKPLTEYLPIQRKPESGKDISEAPIVTQYEMHGVEDLGLLKMDLLGLRNLDVISNCLALVEQTREHRLDIDNVELDDPETFKLLRSGETIGVFQLESAPMRSLIRSLAPTSIDDVAALVALYRPGPMAANMHNDYADRKNGRQPVEYFHPDAEDLLADTYGLMIYQESVMRVAQRFAGYSLAGADNLRKACGKKDRDIMAAERTDFVAGCVSQGYGEKLGTELFDVIEQFADYAFNKSHSYGYGLIAYQIAYLKAHYPVEYFSALLTSVKTKLDSAAVYLNECRSLGIEVTVPDINRSSSDFTPLPDLASDAESPGRILFGLSAIRHVGEGVVAKIVGARTADGPFESFQDFVERIDAEVLNKRTVESLIKAGAFDSLGHRRKGLMQVFESIIDVTLSRRREHDMGVMSLFGEVGEAPSFDERPEIPDVEYDRASKLANERVMLGLYISDHPVHGFEGRIRSRADRTVAELAESADGASVKVGGVITSLTRKSTRRGDLMAVFELEDLSGTVETMVFPRTMTEHGHKLEEDAVALVTGRVEIGDDLPKLFVHDVEILVQLAEDRPLRVRPPGHLRPDVWLDQLHSTLADHPGDIPVVLQLGDGSTITLPPECSVDTGNGLIGELRVLFGADAVVA